MITIMFVKSDLYIWLVTTNLLDKPLTSIKWDSGVLSTMEDPEKRGHRRRLWNILHWENLRLPSQKVQESSILDNPQSDFGPA